MLIGYYGLIVVILLAIPAIMLIGALVTIYYYGLIAVIPFGVIGALFSGCIPPLLGGDRFRGRILKDSFFAFLLITLFLMIYYGAVHFFKDGNYLIASVFLIFPSTPLLYYFAVMNGYDVSLKGISNFLNKKNPLKQTYKKNDKDLETAFNKTLSHKKSIQSFIITSSKIARSSPYAKRLKFQFANYSTKLLLSCIAKKDYDSAEKIVNNYINNLLPFAGRHRKSEDLASNALTLVMLNNNEKIGQKVMNKLLGPDFDINSTNNEILLFNLACYYAMYRQKRMMLQSIERALSQGKKADQFFSDSDFNYYLKDKDFIALLKKENKERLQSSSST